jgi:hypothetical protein
MTPSTMHDRRSGCGCGRADVHDVTLRNLLPCTCNPPHAAVSPHTCVRPIRAICVLSNVVECMVMSGLSIICCPVSTFRLATRITSVSHQSHFLVHSVHTFHPSYLVTSRPPPADCHCHCRTPLHSTPSPLSTFSRTDRPPRRIASLSRRVESLDRSLTRIPSPRR